MNFRYMIAAAAIALVATAAGEPAKASNIVVNGDFSGGTYTSTLEGYTNPNVPVGWTPNWLFDLEPGFDQIRPAPGGTYQLSIGNFDFQSAPTLSQTLSTVAGAQYVGSFYVNDGGAVDPGTFFKASIDGNSLVSLTGIQAIPNILETFSFTGTGSDVLTLTGNNSPSEWFVTDVSVASVSPVPLPAALPLFGSAVIGFVAWGRRRRAKKAVA